MNDAPQTWEIKITYDGVNVGISAPMDNKVLCYGMLRFAEDMISKHQKPAIEKPSDKLVLPK